MRGPPTGTLLSPYGTVRRAGVFECGNTSAVEGVPKIQAGFLRSPSSVNSRLLFTSPVSGHCQKEAWLCRLQSTIPHTKLTRSPIAHKPVCVLCLLPYHLPSTLGPSDGARLFGTGAGLSPSSGGARGSSEAFPAPTFTTGTSSDAMRKADGDVP